MLHYNIHNLNLRKLFYLIVSIYILYVILQVISYGAFKTKKSIPVLCWWTPFTFDNNDRIISCYNDVYKCLISNNKTHKYVNLHAYLIYGSRIENHDFPLPRNKSIPWALFHEESPKNYAPLLFKEMQNLFNISSTFSRYSDFPVTLQYLQNLDLIKDKKFYVPVDIKNKYLKDVSPVLYIQSDCDTPVGRDSLVKELGKYVAIDSYGKCLTNRTFPEEFSDVYALDLYNEDLLRFISKYKFIVSFENAICDDYITEKLWRPLIVGSVPIYFGSPTIEDWLPNKNSAILIKDFKDMKAVGEFINLINKNDTKYESFLQHKTSLKISNLMLEKYILDDYPITAFECFVCKKIYENDYNIEARNVNFYNCPKSFVSEKDGNTWNQHWQIGQVQSKALRLLIDKDEPFSPKIFEETWKKLLHNRD